MENLHGKYIKMKGNYKTKEVVTQLRGLVSNIITVIPAKACPCGSRDRNPDEATYGFRIKYGMTRWLYMSFLRKHVPAEAGAGIRTRQ